MVFASPSPSGRSLVDHLRQHPPANHRLVMWGVDPDLRTLGWARIQTAFTKPSTAPAAIEHLWLGVWAPPTTHKDDIDQTNAMIGSFKRRSSGVQEQTPWWEGHERSGIPQFVTAEAQRVYPDRNERPGTVVAKANDLLRLAQISGAFQGMFADADYARCRSFKPDVWKHNAKKEAMHTAVIQRVGEGPVHVWMGTDVTTYGSLSEVHKKLTKAAGRLDVFDALCLAYFGIDEIMCGRWVI